MLRYFWHDFYSSLESVFCSNLYIKSKTYISIYVLVVVRMQKSSRHIVHVYSTWHATQHTQHHTTPKNCQVNIPVTFYQSWSRRRTDTEAAGCYCWWRHAHCCALGAGSWARHQNGTGIKWSMEIGNQKTLGEMVSCLGMFGPASKAKMPR